MNIFRPKMFLFFAAILSLTIYAQNKSDGWEEGSRYNRLFSIKKIDTVSGIIINISQAAPMQGMAEGIQLLVLCKKDTVKDTIIVHLCPKWLSKYLNLDLPLKEVVSIEGCKAVCKGKPVFIASKLTSNGIILQLRDDNGIPIWDRLR